MTNEKDITSIVYLFHEGKTELGYLQSLAKNRRIRIVPKLSIAAPVKLIEKAIRFAVEVADDLRGNPYADIWVVFDHDDKVEDMAGVKTAMSKCPPICKKGCKIRDIKRCEAKDAVAKIHIAFMSPCIEIWGIICTEEGARMDKFSCNRH